MESHPNPARVTFDTLQSRLLAIVNFRIRNGEFTERALARMLHVSQPQMHNVLKRQRKLQWKLADALLLNLGLSIIDLLDVTGTQEQTYILNPDFRNKKMPSGRDASRMTGDSSTTSRCERKPPESDPELWTAPRRVV